MTYNYYAYDGNQSGVIGSEGPSGVNGVCGKVGVDERTIAHPTLGFSQMTEAERQIRNELKYINVNPKDNKMYLPSVIQNVNNKAYMAIGTEGYQETFETLDEASDWAEQLVQRNEKLEFVIMKAMTKIHAERPPVVRKEIK